MSEKSDESRGRDPEGSYEFSAQQRSNFTTIQPSRTNTNNNAAEDPSALNLSMHSSSGHLDVSSRSNEQYINRPHFHNDAEEEEEDSDHDDDNDVNEDQRHIIHTRTTSALEPSVEEEDNMAAAAATSTSEQYQADRDLALALALQEELNSGTQQRRRTKDDAQKQQRSSNNNNHENEPLSSSSYAATTAPEQAWEFTTRLVQEYNRQMESFLTDDITAQYCPFISLVNADDVLFFTEHLLRHSQEALGDTAVDVGYLIGYSDDKKSKDGSSRLRSRSLWTTDGPFGDGIYTSNNPFVDTDVRDIHSTKSYQIMIMARLKGAVVVAGQSIIDGLSPYDSVIVNEGVFDEVCILGRPTQCVPLLIFDSTVMDRQNDTSIGNAMIHAYHTLFQGILDDKFNVGKSRTVVRNVLPSQRVARRVSAQQPQQDPPANQRVVSSPTSTNTLLPTLNCVVFYTSPNSLDDMRDLSGDLMFIKASSKPTTLIINKKSARHPTDKRNRNLQHCSSWINYVSMIPSKSDVGDDAPKVTLAYACGSTFEVSASTHGRNSSTTTTIESLSQAWSTMLDNPMFLQRLQLRASEHTKKCSTCIKASMDPHDDMLTIGCMPTGSMRIDKRPDLTCQGHDPGSYVISYRFEGGFQQNYHENPGVPYDAAHKEAYIPSNKEGRDLLKRLVIAFACGMTFKVGTSISSGLPNRVTWTSISHKTSLMYGPFGYPDPDYLRIVNEDLDALGIPTANQL